MPSPIHRKLPALSALAVAIAASPPALAREKAPDRLDAARVAQAMLEDLQAVSGVPGFGAAVWKDGKVVWTGAAGMRDREAGLPVDPDTRFRLASVSKLLAATAAAKLAEEGRLDLDAPVGTVLPWLANDWPPITARQLAAHVSGLPHYQEQDMSRGKTRYATGRDAVAIFSGRALIAPPGTRYSYSSWGYTLLGAMVEEASGQPFGDYVRSAVAPGLDVGLDATGEPGGKASSAYDFVQRAAVPAAPHDLSYTWAGGGMMASARDLARFGGAMLEDRIISRATFERMLQPVLLASGEPAGEDGYTVGFGWRSGADGDGAPIAFHNGATFGARSSLVLWRGENVAATILSNASWTSAIDRTAEMLAAPFRPGRPGAGAAPCPTGASRFEGRFGEAEVSGAARFSLRDGICRGELAMAKPMSNFFAGGPQPGGETVRIVALAANGKLGRSGLVTPFGIYDLRREEDGSSASALGATRRLVFRLAP